VLYKNVQYRIILQIAPGLPTSGTVMFDSGERPDPHAAMSPVDGVGYGLCTRRPGLDHALVETARDAGAEVGRQGTVVELLRDRERISGARCSTRDATCGARRAAPESAGPTGPRAGGAG
jgi:hypothetical protein